MAENTYKKYYKRGIRFSMPLFIITAILMAALIVCLVYALKSISNAPYWTYLVLLLVYIVFIWVFLKSNHFYIINPERKTLQGGNTITGRVKDIAPLSNFIQVIYLPHTREVKLTTGDGDSFIKLTEPKQFVDDFQAVYEQLFPEEEDPESETSSIPQ